jgi:hypothetical protein
VPILSGVPVRDCAGSRRPIASNRERPAKSSQPIGPCDSNGSEATQVEGRHVVPSEAEVKLDRLVTEAERHRESEREFRLAGYAAVADRHQRLFELVCSEIRFHCREFGLELPEWLPPEKG